MKDVLFILFLCISVYSDLCINKDDLYNHVFALTNTPLPRNFSNIESLDSAARYISNEFAEYGYLPYEQKFKIRGKEYKNIIVTIGPKDKEKIIIGAHYDVCGDQHGADDNASGVAGLLEIARVLKLNEKKLSYCFEIVAYTLEEPPFFNTKAMGSYIHADYLKRNNEKVKFMISLEMIGFFTEEKIQEYPVNIAKLFYPSRGNFILILGHNESKKEIRGLSRVYKRHTNIKSRRLTAFNKSGMGALSDHVSYRRCGFKAFMITDTSHNRNKNLHRRSDTIRTLDFDKMKEVVKGITYYLMNLK